MKDEVIGMKIPRNFSAPSVFILVPSSFPRVPLAVPYWSGDTYGAILRAVISGAVIDGPDLPALQAELIERLAVADALLCGSGSLAIEIALRLCGVKHGDEVLIPTFCCSAVVPPVLALGALPMLADVGEELNLTVETVDAAITRNTKAIIVPHLFGNPAEIKAIVDFAGAKNVCVIDDAAQALGATIAGQPVGSFGDVGILSFGAEKICFGLGGGAVVATNPDLLSKSIELGLASPDRFPTLRKCFSTLIWRHWRRWTFSLGDLLARQSSSAPDAPVEPYRKEHMANLNAAVAGTLLRTLDENIAGRRERIRAYCELLGDEQGLELVKHRPGSAALNQVVCIGKRRRGVDRALALVDALHNAGYEVQGSYVPIHRLSHASMCAWDRLPYAERVWPDLVELPCEPNVTMDQLEQIATITKRVLADGRQPALCKSLPSGSVGT